MEHGNHTSGPERERSRDVLDLRRRILRLERRQREMRSLALLGFLLLVIPGGQALVFMGLVLGGLMWLLVQGAAAVERWSRGPALLRRRSRRRR